MPTCKQGEKYAAGTFPAAGEVAIIEWSKKSQYNGHKEVVIWNSASGVGYAYEAYSYKYTPGGQLHTVMANMLKAIYKCKVVEEAAGDRPQVGVAQHGASPNGDPEPLENNGGDPRALERSVTNQPQILGGRRRRRSRKFESRRRLRKRTHKH